MSVGREKRAKARLYKNSGRKYFLWQEHKVTYKSGGKIYIHTHTS